LLMVVDNGDLAKGNRKTLTILITETSSSNTYRTGAINKRTF
jgi:hypothetical protein